MFEHHIAPKLTVKYGQGKTVEISEEDIRKLSPEELSKKIERLGQQSK
jgi:hypothetical protein